MTEETKNLVPVMMERLETSSEVIEDLVQVFDMLGNTYNVRIGI